MRLNVLAMAACLIGIAYGHGGITRYNIDGVDYDG
jgi:hypothetical protein